MKLKKMAAMLVGLTALVSCNRHSEIYKELVKNGTVHDAEIISIDSVKEECTYRLVLNDNEYYGHCKQKIDDGLMLKTGEIILVVYLPRDPTVSRRLNDH